MADPFGAISIEAFAKAKRTENSQRFLQGQPQLKEGGGDGTSGDMEARVAKIEGDLREARADLKVIGRDVAEIKGRVSQLPTTIQLVGFIAAIFVASGLVKHYFP